MALVLGEMAERTYKKQYGLLITDDLDDRYEDDVIFLFCST